MSNKNKEPMKPLQWKEGCSTLIESLGISDKRGEELDYRLRLIIHEITKPLKRGEQSPDSATFIKMCLSLAVTEEERIFCAYVAGGKVVELFEAGEFEEWEDD